MPLPTSASSSMSPELLLNTSENYTHTPPHTAEETGIHHERFLGHSYRQLDPKRWMNTM